MFLYISTGDMFAMKEKINSFYTWSVNLAHTKWGVWALFICALTDACCLPMPTNVFFLALALLNIESTYKLALFGTLGTVVGAVIGYGIGYFAWVGANGEFTALARFVFDNVPGFSEIVYGSIQVQFDKWGFWILFVASLIPVPYKLFSISSGVFDINFFVMCIATLVSQGVKFYAIAFLIIKLGPKVKNLLEYNFKPIAIACTVIATFAFVVFKTFY